MSDINLSVVSTEDKIQNLKDKVNKLEEIIKKLEQKLNDIPVIVPQESETCIKKNPDNVLSFYPRSCH